MEQTKVKWIDGYEGLYDISTDGKIRRHTSTDIKECRQVQNKAGYLNVSLSKNGVSKTYIAHRLVAKAFIEKEDGKDIVDHIDEDKTNNNVNNLRWCTHFENATYYCTKDGRRHQLEIDNKRKHKLKEYKRYINEKEREIIRLNKELELTKDMLDKRTKKLKDYEHKLNKSSNAIAKYANKVANEKYSSSYSGYADTRGIKFLSVDDMVGATGKKVIVNGILFQSGGNAAAYIVKQELLRSIVRNKDTLSKEIRRVISGIRNEYTMYGRYKIERA